jgi:hypothetical protein
MNLREIVEHGNQYLQNAPRSLFESYVGALSLLRTHYTSIENISYVTKIMIDCDRSKKVFEIVVRTIGIFSVLGTVNKEKPDEFNKVYIESLEYFGAAADAPVYFRKNYYPSFYDLAFDSDNLIYCGGVGSLWIDNSDKCWLDVWQPFMSADRWGSCNHEPFFELTREIIDGLSRCNGDTLRKVEKTTQ